MTILYPIAVVKTSKNGEKAKKVIEFLRPPPRRTRFAGQALS